ncbi:protein TRIGALACTOSYLDIACYLGLYCEROL 3, chloroplastic isoform X2 [Benincasa hispida]|uniref:protein TRIGALACTOSYLDIACYLGLYCEROL 3, chloroplastic isoform X2 n=1 Tax=Benincasa hispida TaxID=102211 RepID=UPI001901A23B|nr:protein TRIGALACTOSYLDIACYLGLYCEROL 3, chloroplastic isoform X2 [Benincasa hispida]
MVSISGSVFFPLTVPNCSARSRKVAVLDAHNSFCCKKKDQRRIVVCNCIAPPPYFKSDGSSAVNSNDSFRSEHLSPDNEDKDESDVLIECRNVYKSFGEKHILRGVSFKIRHGEAVGVIGPSGTGKSTILKIIAGLLSPDKGEVYIRGRKRFGLIDDEELSGLRIGLGVEDRLPSELSGGMKKRVALARSIIFDNTRKEIEPEVLLYDEPTAGLDPIASTVVEDLIRSVHIKGEDASGKPGKIASYIVVTHQHSTIRRAVDRLLFLYEGKVVWQGMTDEFTTSTNPIVQQFASGSLDGPIRY